MNRALLMGRSVSCAAFECFSMFLEWAVQYRTGLPRVVHYLDDFLFAGPAGSGHCHQLHAAFQNLTEEMGVLLGCEKSEGPCQVLTFLGTELDTVAQTSCFPPGKLADLLQRVTAFQNK